MGISCFILGVCLVVSAATAPDGEVVAKELGGRQCGAGICNDGFRCCSPIACCPNKYRCCREFCCFDDNLFFPVRPHTTPLIKILQE